MDREKSRLEPGRSEPAPAVFVRKTPTMGAAGLLSPSPVQRRHFRLTSYVHAESEFTTVIDSERLREA